MKKRILAFAILIAMLFQAPNMVQAANTAFMVPEISADWDPPGMVWKSPYLDALAYKGYGGFVADIIVTRSLKEAVADLNANVSAGDYSLSILGIVLEGEVLTDEIMQMIAAEGWTRIEVYYPTFEITGNPNCAGMTPSIAKTDDPAMNQILTNAGYTTQVATVKIEGITMSDPWTILYEPEFNFLRGKNCTMYKYLSDIQKFVPGPTVDADGYSKNFIGMENLTTVDGSPNGTYVIATSALPADLVITAADVQPLRDQLKQQEEENKRNEGIVTNEDESIEWTFANKDIPENFTAEATVEVSSEKEVIVDFAYSGKLPEGTQVTIQLPDDASINKDGEKLFFYYYNPETQAREFVSEGMVQDGKVTFAIKHCSEYIITTEAPVAEDLITDGAMDEITDDGTTDDGTADDTTDEASTPDFIPIIGVGVVVIAIGVAVAVIMKKKKGN